MNRTAQKTLKQIGQSDQSNEEKETSFLEFGCTYFDMMIGIISKVNGQNYTVEKTFPIGIIPSGECFDLFETICSETTGKCCAVSFTQAKNTQWATHPAYQKFLIEAYIGAPYFKNDQMIGTINFSSTVTRNMPFNDDDIKIINLLSEEIGRLA